MGRRVGTVKTSIGISLVYLKSLDTMASELKLKLENETSSCLLVKEGDSLNARYQIQEEYRFLSPSVPPSTIKFS